MWSPARTTTVSALERSRMFMFRSTASAVPRYHSATRPRAMYGWRSFTPPVLRSRSHGRPRPMWSFSERGLYWVRTTTLSINELTQFESVKSMIRYLPPKGTAGFARTPERIERRSPSPPARITAIVRFTPRMLARAPGSRPHRRSARAALQEEARVDEVAVEHDRPVEVRAGRVTGVPLVADQLPARHMTAGVDPARITRL